MAAVFSGKIFSDPGRVIIRSVLTHPAVIGQVVGDFADYFLKFQILQPFIMQRALSHISAPDLSGNGSRGVRIPLMPYGVPHALVKSSSQTGCRGKKAHRQSFFPRPAFPQPLRHFKLRHKVHGAGVPVHGGQGHRQFDPLCQSPGFGIFPVHFPQQKKSILDGIGQRKILHDIVQDISQSSRWKPSQRMPMSQGGCFRAGSGVIFFIPVMMGPAIQGDRGDPHDASAPLAVIYRFFDAASPCLKSGQTGISRRPARIQLRDIPDPADRHFLLPAVRILGFQPVVVGKADIMPDIPSDAFHAGPAVSPQHAAGGKQRHLCIIGDQRHAGFRIRDILMNPGMSGVLKLHRITQGVPDSSS